MLAFETQAQIEDLYDLAQGEIVLTSYLYDENKDFWGYFFLSDEGESNKDNHTYKYTVLDKNLNRITSDDFEQSLSRVMKPNYKVIRKLGDSIFIHATTDYYSSSSNIWLPKINTLRVIDLQSKNKSVEYLIKGASVTKNTMTAKELYYDNRRNMDIKEITTIPYKGRFAHLHFSGSGSMGGSGIEHVNLLDKDFNTIWTLRTKKINEYKPCLVDDYVVEGNQIILSLSTISGSMWGYSKLGFRIVGVDLLTGETTFNRVIEKPDDKYMHSFTVDVTKDRINLLGSYGDYDPGERYELPAQSGFFKFAYDLHGEELLKEYMPWTKASKHIAVDEKGRMDKKYYISALQTASFTDGSSVIIAEKTIPVKISIGKSILFGGAAYAKKKTTDLLCFLYDDQFDLSNVEIIEKSKTKGSYSDFLFGQYIKDKTGMHFFFQDLREAESRKEKDRWILGINTIVDGKFSSDEIPLTAEDYVINPLLAKEGYILIREFNKKEKYNKLRLERLNY